MAMGLIYEARRILSELPPEIFLSTFDAWIHCLERFATIGGDYVED
jgi:hypothetical protein